jgi:4-amino-4-deoxy-L-arabinose transferase-like glycosyltransferase
MGDISLKRRTCVAGLLMAVENLNVVMSRVGLLDIHLEFWIVLAFVLFLLDRRWIDRRQAVAGGAIDGEPDHPDPPPDIATAEAEAEPETSPLPPPPVVSPIWRPWRFAAGAALGAAAAVKWSGAFALFAVVVLAYMWETTRRHRGDRTWLRSFGRAVSRESFGIVLALPVLSVPAILRGGVQRDLLNAVSCADLLESLRAQGEQELPTVTVP